MINIDPNLVASLGLLTPSNEIQKELISLNSVFIGPQEIITLYSLVKDYYTEGEIWELGTGSGCSAYALGLPGKHTIHTFDNFCIDDIEHFENMKRLGVHGMAKMEDQAHNVLKSVNVKIHKMDLETYEFQEWIEGKYANIIHIDAIKNLSMLEIIMPSLLRTVKPGTVWVFQDFAVFHFYELAIFLSLLMYQSGSVIGGAEYGILYFKFKEEPFNVDVLSIESMTLDQKLEHLYNVYTMLKKFNHLFKGNIEDHMNGAVAMVYNDFDDILMAWKYINKPTYSTHFMKRHADVCRDIILPRENELG